MTPRRLTPSALGLAALLAAGHAQATLLNFDGVWDAARQAGYGDRVSGIGTGYGAEGGATPNVTMAFVPLSTTTPFTVYRNGYGSLSNALGHGNFDVPSEIRFTADPGFEVLLSSFQLGGWSASAYPNSRVWVTDDRGAVLWDTGLATWPATTTRSYSFAEPLRSTGTLTLHINDLGDLGLDNVVFSQVAVVPEPQTWALMLGGLAAVGLLKGRAGRR